MASEPQTERIQTLLSLASDMAKENGWSLRTFLDTASTSFTQPIVVEAFVQPLVISAHFNCPICNDQIREPSPQSGRSWCNTCGDYVLAQKAINA